MGNFFSKSFDPTTDIPLLTDRVVIVTGANTGLGYQTALALASHGAKVYIGARSEAKAVDAIRRMEAENKALVGAGRLIWLPMDLASIKNAKAAAEEFLSKETRLDLLVNNAGLGNSPFELTGEGFEKGIATQHLGHFAFTITLLPVLNATAQLAGSDVRVVNVSSAAYTYAPKDVTFETPEDFKKAWADDNSMDTFMNMIKRYALSKLANILFTNELQRRWDSEGIPALAVSVNPGPVATDAARRMFGIFSVLLRPMMSTPAQGAKTSLFAAVSPEVKARPDKYKAQYLVPYGAIENLNAKASDTNLSQQLWKTSEEVVADVLSRA